MDTILSYIVRKIIVCSVKTSDALSLKKVPNITIDTFPTTLIHFVGYSKSIIIWVLASFNQHIHNLLGYCLALQQQPLQVVNNPFNFLWDMLLYHFHLETILISHTDCQKFHEKVAR